MIALHGLTEHLATGGTVGLFHNRVLVCDSAPVGSALSAYFGHRPVVMAGGLLSSIGMVAGSYAQDLLQLYITVGFLTGKSTASSRAYGCAPAHTLSRFSSFVVDSQLEKVISQL